MRQRVYITTKIDKVYAAKHIHIVYIKCKMSTSQREWGFHIENQKHTDEVIKLLKRYNLTRHSAPPLIADRIIRTQVNGEDRYYLSVISQGYAPSYFIEANYSGSVYYPSEKPMWWDTCNDVVWTRDSGTQMSFPEPKDINIE